MGLSDCECGGTIALGPEASNRCDKCGAGVFGFYQPKPPHEDCEICDLLAKANHAVHVNQILHEAWDRAKALPIIKSMTPGTRLLIARAILGA